MTLSEVLVIQSFWFFLVWDRAKKCEFQATFQVTLMPLVCGPHFENFTVQRKETLNRAAGDSESTLKSIKVSGFHFFFFSCRITFVTISSMSSLKLWFKKVIKVINGYLKQAKSLFVYVTYCFQGPLHTDTSNLTYFLPSHPHSTAHIQNSALSTFGALE